jgi:hypothetical protein
MKLAEALILRSDSQKRLEQLKARVLRVAKVQEGEPPAENPTELLAEAERVAEQLERLIKQINRTNAATPVDATRTLSDALAERDVLGMRRGLLADVAEAATISQDRYSRSEVKFKSTINVAVTQATADGLARTFRELDARIQQLNWTTDLLD